MQLLSRDDSHRVGNGFLDATTVAFKDLQVRQIISDQISIRSARPVDHVANGLLDDAGNITVKYF